MDILPVEQLRRQLMERLDLYGRLEDSEILEVIDELVLHSEICAFASLTEKESIRKELFDSVRRLDVIQELIDDPEVTEIMVNGTDRIYTEKNGRITRFQKSFADEERLLGIIRQIAGRCNRVVNEQSPIVDARLENGDRVNIVLPPVALDGPVLTIRRFPREAITMKRLIALGTITKEAADFLEKAVINGVSILVSGGTSTGKTTFLNSLSFFIPEDERVITIEDNAELQLQMLPNLVRLQVKEANYEGQKGISIRELIKASLRMRPSRIIIGEVRGGEAADFLNCLNTGHSGSLGSVHANSVRDVPLRLEMMVRMASDLPVSVIRSQIAAGIGMVVQLKRDREGKRKVDEISEISGMEGDRICFRTVFKRKEDGSLIKTNTSLFIKEDSEE